MTGFSKTGVTTGYLKSVQTIKSWYLNICRSGTIKNYDSFCTLYNSKMYVSAFVGCNQFFFITNVSSVDTRYACFKIRVR